LKRQIYAINIESHKHNDVHSIPSVIISVHTYLIANWIHFALLCM